MPANNRRGSNCSNRSNRSPGLRLRREFFIRNRLLSPQDHILSSDSALGLNQVARFAHIVGIAVAHTVRGDEIHETATTSHYFCRISTCSELTSKPRSSCTLK